MAATAARMAPGGGTPLPALRRAWPPKALPASPGPGAREASARPKEASAAKVVAAETTAAAVAGPPAKRVLLRLRRPPRLGRNY